MTPTISKKLFLNVNPHILQDDSFIRDIHGSPIKRAIVKGLVEFSTASRSMLIAEGVETFEELDCVLHLGVQYAQGYLIQRPKREITPISSEAPDFIHNQKLKKNPQSVLPYSYQEVRHLYSK